MTFQLRALLLGLRTEKLLKESPLSVSYVSMFYTAICYRQSYQEILGDRLVRKQISGVLEHLNYDFRTFSIEHFMEHVQNYRQRRIIYRPFAFSPGISGAWVKEKTTDFVFFSAKPI